MEKDIRYSRPLATAERLGDIAEDRHRFADKHVLVTGEPSILSTANGQESLLASLRLLIRICRNVSVALPCEADHLLARSKEEIQPLAFGGPVRFDAFPGDPSSYDAILSIGSTAKPDLPWTVINSNGWLARVSSGRMSLPSDCGAPNPIAALAAASLGVSEVFKRLIRLKPSRGALLDGLSFSLFNYRSDERDPGPPLPAELNINLMVAGAGAIGNGIVYTLSKLPIGGRLNIVDRQCFGPENLGTCILIGPANIGKRKAEVAAAYLSRRIKAGAYAEDLESFEAHLGAGLPYPNVILNGLDNIDARHQVQKLWADLTVDGAIGDLGRQVSRHPWGEDVACLICLFREPPGQLAEVVESRASGLSRIRVQQGMDVVTEEDVQATPQKKRAQLGKQIGRQICSVVQEAIARQLSEEELEKGFAPSVPFVACLGASMVVGEMVKHYAGWPTPLEPKFQFDVLHGPAFGQMFPQARRRDCVCVARAHNIEVVRQKHYSMSIEGGLHG